MRERYFLYFFIIFSIFFIYTSGQIPAGYYDSAAGLNGLPLKTALHNIIKNHNSVNYTDLHSFYPLTDKKSNGKVWDMYSDNPTGTPPYEYSFVSADQCGNYAQEGDCYNREHTWPKSWFNSATPMYSDLFMVYPTDGYVNGRRSSYPYGVVGTATWTSQNGSKLGNCIYPGYTLTVFEPIDAYKGDLARSYFYMSVRYFGEDAGWPGSDMVTGAEMKQWALNMMLDWHHNDPVSQKEIDRNNAVYNIQNNRNPFIDHPEWVDSVWLPTGKPYLNTIDKQVSVYPSPTSGKLYINAEKIISIELFDILGNSLCKFKTDKEIDISKFPKGVYVVQVVTGFGISTHKILRK